MKRYRRKYGVGSYLNAIFSSLLLHLRYSLNISRNTVWKRGRCFPVIHLDTGCLDKQDTLSHAFLCVFKKFFLMHFIQRVIQLKRSVFLPYHSVKLQLYFSITFFSDSHSLHSQTGKQNLILTDLNVLPLNDKFVSFFTSK